MINIAIVLSRLGNNIESITNFNHALEVLERVVKGFEEFDGDLGPFKQLKDDAIIEKQRIHMTCAGIFKQME